MRCMTHTGAERELAEGRVFTTILARLGKFDGVSPELTGLGIGMTMLSSD